MSDLSMPSFDAGSLGQVESSFLEADLRLEGARRHRKARKKIRPQDVEAVRNGRIESSRATRQSQAEWAQPVKMGSFEVEAVVAGGAVAPLLRVPPDYVLGELPPRRNGALGSDPSAENIAEMLAQLKADDEMLVAQLLGVGQQRGEQIRQNKGLAQGVQQEAKLEKDFGLRESRFQGEVRRFTGLAQKFQQIQETLAKAAVAIHSAASAIEAAAAACAAIPYVGPAIAAALRIAARALRLAAKVLETVSRKMQAVSRVMKSAADKSLGAARQMLAQKTAAMGRKLGLTGALRQGQQRLQSLTEPMGVLRSRLEEVSRLRQELTGRLGSLQPTSQVRRSRAEWEVSLQKAVSQVEMVRLAVRDPVKLLEQQRQLRALWDEMEGSGGTVSQALQGRTRKALQGSGLEPADSERKPTST